MPDLLKLMAANVRTVDRLCANSDVPQQWRAAMEEIERLRDAMFDDVACDDDPDWEGCRCCKWLDNEFCIVTGREVPPALEED